MNSVLKPTSWCRLYSVAVGIILTPCLASGAIVASGNCAPDPSSSRWAAGIGAGNSAVVGDTGPGYLTIDDDSDVVATRIDVGAKSTGRGSMVLDGPGSTLQMTHWDFQQRYTPVCIVGTSGHGYVDVINGAEFRTTGIGGVTSLGHYEGSFGSVRVDGPGSFFNAKALYVGQYGTGVVTLSNGGTANAGGLTMKRFGTGTARMHIHVGGNGVLTLGSSGLENNGTIHLYAARDLASGVYTPISTTGAIIGSGGFVSHGGLWDTASRTFTVGAVADGTGGLTDADLSGQRYSFESGSLTAAFAGDAGVADFNVIALAISMLGGEQVLGAFDFDTTLSGGSTLLSYEIGAGHGLDDLKFWHRQDGSGDWVEFTPDHANISGDRVEFTVDGFSGYAVSTIPEPGVGALVLMVSLVALRRVRS